MGGQGSGRPPSFDNQTVESYRAIDVNHLHRGGWLCPGRRGTLTWTRAGLEVANVAMSAAQGSLQLSYRIRASQADWEDVEQHVGIEHTPCHLGGTRPFFICSGEVEGTNCGMRVTKLYGAGRYYLCRHCYGLKYACQREQPWDRSARRADKIRKRLGGSPGIYTLFPDKPRGMWWRTYERLFSEAEAASIAAEQAILKR